MAKYQKTVNIWAKDVNLKTLQPGQWVEAGEGGDRGIFGGVTKGGSVIVAWYRNAKAKRAGGYRGYVKNMMVYAKCWSAQNVKH